MKYKELIQFDPIEEIIKFDRLDDIDYRKEVVRNFVCSQSYEDYILPQICGLLDLAATKETKGIQIVGNYGTGKSHLMSLFTIIAEDATYLPLLKSSAAKDSLKTIAGKYKVHRFELGNTDDLWDIITYRIDNALHGWGIDYSISDDLSPDTYTEKLNKMLAAFEEKYPDSGFMLVVDEMLSYLKGRCQPDKLNRDLAVLQALGQVSDRSRFRMVFGVQELIYKAPEFQFARDMLSHVNDRYRDFTIKKEDVQFIVQQRLLQKNEHQKGMIREHLSNFTKMFPDMNNNMDTYVSLFPVHPSYFDNFSMISIDKSQREVLKTLSFKFEKMQDEDIPESQPGLICYDSYWQDMLSNADIANDPDVRKVSQVTSLIDQKIDNFFTGGKRNKIQLAHRIVSAAAIRILQADLTKQNGVTAEDLAKDLCYADYTCENYDELVDLSIGTVLRDIVRATVGQFFEKGEGAEFHLRIDGGVNYEQNVKNFAEQMSNETKDSFFYNFLIEALPITDQRYRSVFNIWRFALEWHSHKCTREGYIFMGNPEERSTTQPKQHFYLFFMPIFVKQTSKSASQPDSVYFNMEELSEDFKEQVSLYGASLSLEGSSSSDEKPSYKYLHDKFYKCARDIFNNEYLTKTTVRYMNTTKALNLCTGADGDSKLDVFRNVASHILENHFEDENPSYPKFSLLYNPITADNRKGHIENALKKVANPTFASRVGEAVLNGLGLWNNGGLSIKDSLYAQSLKSKLAGKGGKVLNREEILQVFYEDRNEYVTQDFQIEADLEMIVLGSMAALGELEITLSTGNRINASNLDLLTHLQPNDYYTFSNVCPPKGINLVLVRELMVGLVGSDRTNEIDDPNTSVFAEMLAESKRIAEKVEIMKFEVRYGYSLPGGIEIISAHDANQLKISWDTLKGIAEKMQRYCSRAKLRNIPKEWTIEMVNKAMTTTKQSLYDTETLLEEMKRFKDILNYLLMALSNIYDNKLRNDIEDAKSELSNVASLNKQQKDLLMKKLEKLRDRYADFYMKEYLKATLNPLHVDWLAELKNGEQRLILQQMVEEELISGSRYAEWKHKLDSIKIGNPVVTKQYIKSSPTAPDGFKPEPNLVIPTTKELKSELSDMYDDMEKTIREYINDPEAVKNWEVLDADKRALLNKYLRDDFKFSIQNVTSIAKLVKELQKSIKRLKIESSELLKAMSRPMKPDEAISAFRKLIESKTKGADPNYVRITII